MIDDSVIRHICIACLLPSYKDREKLNHYLINNVWVNQPQKIVSLNHYFKFDTMSMTDAFTTTEQESHKRFIKHLYYYTYEHMVKQVAKITLTSEKVAEQIYELLASFGIESSFYKNRLTIDYKNKKALSVLATGL